MDLNVEHIDIQSLFRNYDYQDLILSEKEQFIINLFHSNNWKKISATDRIYIIKELERIRSIRENRKPYEVCFAEDYEMFNNILIDFGINPTERKFFVRKSLVEQGLKQDYINGIIRYIKMDNLNIEILNNFLHEQYHINTYEQLRKEKEYSREVKEHAMWLTLTDYFEKGSDTQKYIKSGKEYLYRFIPDEYYAFKYSFSKTMDYFVKMQKTFGPEKGLIEYILQCKLSEEQIVKNFIDNEKKYYDYDHAYQYVLQRIIDGFCEKEHYDKKIVVEELEATKRKVKLYKSTN